MQKVYRNVFFLACLIVASGCSHRPGIHNRLNLFLQRETLKFFISDYKGKDSNVVSEDRILNEKLTGQIISINDSVIHNILSYKDGRLWGETLKTFENGKIMEYAFKVNEENVTFIKGYDLQGEVIYEQGTPLAIKVIDGAMNGDSLIIDFVFADRIYKWFKVQISEDGLQYRPISPQIQGDYYPHKSYTHKRYVRGLSRMVVYFEMECEDLHTSKVSFYRDTLDLEKRE